MNESDAKKNIHRTLIDAAGYKPATGFGLSREEAIQNILSLIYNPNSLTDLKALVEELDKIVRMVVAYSDGYPGYKVGAATEFVYDLIKTYVQENK